MTVEDLLDGHAPEWAEVLMVTVPAPPLRPTRDGNLLIHQSSTNRIILVTLNSAK